MFSIFSSYMYVCTVFLTYTNITRPLTLSVFYKSLLIVHFLYFLLFNMSNIFCANFMIQAANRNILEASGHFQFRLRQCRAGRARL